MTSYVTKKVSYSAFSYACRLSRSALSVGQSRLLGPPRSREDLEPVKVPLRSTGYVRWSKNYARWANLSRAFSLQPIRMPWYIHPSNSYDNCWARMFALWRCRQRIKKCPISWSVLVCPKRLLMIAHLSTRFSALPWSRRVLKATYCNNRLSNNPSSG